MQTARYAERKTFDPVGTKREDKATEFEYEIIERAFANNTTRNWWEKNNGHCILLEYKHTS